MDKDVNLGYKGFRRALIIIMDHGDMLACIYKSISLTDDYGIDRRRLRYRGFSRFKLSAANSKFKPRNL